MRSRHFSSIIALLFALSASFPLGAKSSGGHSCELTSETGGRQRQLLPHLQPLIPHNRLRLANTYILRGECARHVVSFTSSRIDLDDGTAWAIGDGATLSRLQLPAHLPLELPADQIPRIEGANFGAAAYVGTVGEKEASRRTAYVAIWTEGGDYLVASYLALPMGRSSIPHPLLRSQLPILAVGFLPGPDTASGQLSLVQRLSPQSVRLLNYEWDHAGLY